MAADSTSRHTMSADRRLSIPERLCWLGLNLLNNTFPGSRVDAKLRELRFAMPPSRLDELWQGIARDASPSRRLSDLFWLTLPWPSLHQQLGPVRIVEMGCGTGAYGRLLEQILGESFGSYLGIDIEPNAQWSEADHPRHSFAVGRAGEAHRFLAGTNLVLTQSALEHFEEDLQFFRHVAAFVLSGTRPVLQVHLVPSAACITTFPWHGVREYTPRTISRITRLFGSETRAYLFALGGSNCNRLHRKYITRPRLLQGRDLRKERNDEYAALLRSAILADFNKRSGGASFYALVLASHFHSDPFQTCAA